MGIATKFVCPTYDESVYADQFDMHISMISAILKCQNNDGGNDHCDLSVPVIWSSGNGIIKINGSIWR